MEAFLRRVDKVCDFLTTALLVALACALLLQVVLRNVFSIGPAWLEESARLLHILMVFLALPLLEREKLQVKVDFVVNLLPLAVGNVFRFFSLFATFVFAGFFLYSGWMLTKKTGDMTMSGTGLPNAILLVPVLIGVLLFTLAVFSAALNQLSAMNKKGGSK
ncbi:MAG: TRAP transporter small permease subunit [Treponemataceae bacterium]